MRPVNIRLSISMNPRGGTGAADLIRRLVQATLLAFEGNITATANALGYSTKTVRKILGGINDSERTKEGSELREADSESAQGDLPQCDQTT